MQICTENQVLPTVHAAGDRTVCSSSWAHGCDNVIVVVFGEAVHQQALVLGQLPELQGACTGPGQTNKEFRQTLKYEDRWQACLASASYRSPMRPRHPCLTPTSHQLLPSQSARPPCRVPHWEPWKGHCRPRQTRASTCHSGWRHRAAARHLSRKCRVEGEKKTKKKNRGAILYSISAYV